jgi:hypothetical protein
VFCKHNLIQGFLYIYILRSSTIYLKLIVIFEIPYYKFLLINMGMPIIQAVARYVHRTGKNSSMSISNVIGPVEKAALASYPIKGIYFMTVGVPQVILKLSYLHTIYPFLFLIGIQIYN